MTAKSELARYPDNRSWLASYPPDVPFEIDPEYHRSLVAFFEQSAERFAARPAFRSFGDTLTYAGLDRLSLAFAAYLQQSLGLNKGDRIALMMPNILQYPVALFGALRAGLVVVNTNPLYTARELTHQLNDAEVETIIVLENFAHVLGSCIESTPIRNVLITRMGDMSAFPKSALLNFLVKYVRRMVPRYDLPGAIPMRHAMQMGRTQAFEAVDVSPDDLAFLQYTGGTTGLAKGAMLTHRNLVANVEQATAWLRPHIVEGEEVIITALPLYHIFSLTANCLTFMRIGGLNHLIANPRDMRGFARTLRKTRFSAITGVNTLFNGLMNAPGFGKIDFSGLKISLAGGAALQEAVAERWLAATGSPIIEAYGLTETSPAVCINPLSTRIYYASIGLPIPSTEVSIRDEHANDVGFDSPGELWVRGPQVMRGYWRQPKETEKVLTGDAWLKTGDIGEMRPDGYVRLLDRKKDVILVSGFNVYPNEIEDAIAELPGVIEVGVVGIPDDATGEAVMAVIARSDAGPSEARIREHCRTALTGYKQPTHIRFATQLPKNNIGKILRRELRELYVDTSKPGAVDQLQSADIPRTA